MFLSRCKLVCKIMEMVYSKKFFPRVWAQTGKAIAT